MGEKTEKLTTPSEIESYFLADPDELGDFLRGARGIILKGDIKSLEKISPALIVALDMAVGRGDEIEELAEKINEDLTSQGN